jgi:hypothetical protein
VHCWCRQVKEVRGDGSCSNQRRIHQRSIIIDSTRTSNRERAQWTRPKRRGWETGDLSRFVIRSNSSPRPAPGRPPARPGSGQSVVVLGVSTRRREQTRAPLHVFLNLVSCTRSTFCKPLIFHTQYSHCIFLPSHPCSTKNRSRLVLYTSITSTATTMSVQTTPSKKVRAMTLS